MNSNTSPVSRRSFVASSLALGAALVTPPSRAADVTPPAAGGPVLPPAGKRLWFACKLGMITKDVGGKKLTLAARLRLAADAGFDGVDFDEAGDFTPAEARQAVQESGVFVHNAINHAHWSVRFTDPKPELRAKARANLEHCLRVSHAAGGSGVLLVIGKADDGPAAELETRCRDEIRQVLPLAAALGQRVLFENVWNQMMYDHDRGPEQTPERFIRFVDSFSSPWVGMYYDLGNHWKYGQPAAWLHAFGPRCVKLDVKGFSRARDKFVEITGADDDLPWADVRKALADIGFAGWATAEVDGGDVKRLTVVREQMQKALGG